MFRASAGKAVAMVEGETVRGFDANAGAPPLEFRLQIAIQVCSATGPAASDPEGGVRGPSLVPQFLESAHALLRQLSLGLDLGVVWLTSPSGIRLLVQGNARAEDLGAIRAAAAALGQVPAVEPPVTRKVALILAGSHDESEQHPSPWAA